MTWILVDTVSHRVMILTTSDYSCLLLGSTHLVEWEANRNLSWFWSRGVWFFCECSSDCHLQAIYEIWIAKSMRVRVLDELLLCSAATQAFICTLLSKQMLAKIEYVQFGILLRSSINFHNLRHRWAQIKSNEVHASAMDLQFWLS